jgi:hypothetical protein
MNHPLVDMIVLKDENISRLTAENLKLRKDLCLACADIVRLKLALRELLDALAAKHWPGAHPEEVVDNSAHKAALLLESLA